MDNAGQITQETKNKTYKELTDIVLHSLENNSLTVEEAQDASNYILSRIDTLPDQIYFDAFLEELANRWPCFQPILLDQEKKEEEKQDIANIQTIKSEIDQITQK